ncbi:E3 ubiquitin-protein ligase RNF25 [Polyodon spathula]|uniref:E3 ubiquitin-protein ligase RNF25 n=1 Tax=Polyodon spathula TaxID=7913 RepID=UPI001B7F3EFF|nr:E3 ubiquitin-protein ligase RNF25 [Polyodon spathula]
MGRGAFLVSQRFRSVAAIKKKKKKKKKKWLQRGALSQRSKFLEAIYLDELHLTHDPNSVEPWQVSITLFPSTAENPESQFVRLTLHLSLPAQYPNSVPKISIQNPRGLSDEKIRSLDHSLRQLAESSVGCPVLYELIEKGKEILTNNNVPYGQCVICLYSFQDSDALTRTGCYHHFHSHCLGRYIQHSEREREERRREERRDRTGGCEEEEMKVLCPVCREPFTYDLAALERTPAPQFPVEEFTVGEELRKRWAELTKILERQRERGGVIDPEAERNRFLIRIQEVSPEDHTKEPDLQIPDQNAPDSTANQLSAASRGSQSEPFLPEGEPQRPDQSRPGNSKQQNTGNQSKSTARYQEQLDSQLQGRGPRRQGQWEGRGGGGRWKARSRPPQSQSVKPHRTNSQLEGKGLEKGVQSEGRIEIGNSRDLRPLQNGQGGIYGFEECPAASNFDRRARKEGFWNSELGGGGRGKGREKNLRKNWDSIDQSGTGEARRPGVERIERTDSAKSDQLERRELDKTNQSESLETRDSDSSNQSQTGGAPKYPNQCKRDSDQSEKAINKSDSCGGQLGAAQETGSQIDQSGAKGFLGRDLDQNRGRVWKWDDFNPTEKEGWKRGLEGCRLGRGGGGRREGDREGFSQSEVSGKGRGRGRSQGGGGGSCDNRYYHHQRGGGARGTERRGGLGERRQRGEEVGPV